jgi:hypothetical protein
VSPTLGKYGAVTHGLIEEMEELGAVLLEGGLRPLVAGSPRTEGAFLLRKGYPVMQAGEEIDGLKRWPKAVAQRDARPSLILRRLVFAEESQSNGRLPNQQLRARLHEFPGGQLRFPFSLEAFAGDGAIRLEVAKQLRHGDSPFHSSIMSLVGGCAIARLLFFYDLQCKIAELTKGIASTRAFLDVGRQRHERSFSEGAAAFTLLRSERRRSRLHWCLAREVVGARRG